MAVFETTSHAPHGAYAFLKRLAAAGKPLEGSACPSTKARGWTRHHDLVICRRVVRGAGRTTAQGWLYEITDEGRRFLAAADAEERQGKSA